jgi:hypothetical protein
MNMGIDESRKEKWQRKVWGGTIQWYNVLDLTTLHMYFNWLHAPGQGINPISPDDEN